MESVDCIKKTDIWVITMKHTTYVLLLLLLLVFFFDAPLASATPPSKYTFEVIGKIDPSEIISFTIRNTQTHTTYVNYAVAREDGVVAVMSRKGIDENKMPMLRHSFVALYHPDGTFDCELEFVPNYGSLAHMEITEESLNIFLRHFLLVFDLETHQITCYSISLDEAAYNRLNADTFGRKQFTVGEWTYVYKRRGIEDRAGLVRSNGKIEQVLIDLPGNNPSVQSVVIGIGGFIAGVGGVCYYKKRHSFHKK
ncbi:MAG: hypothetical protein IKM13_03520 [Clostridia bacterium]|nr:hypothetical protein [Clostridia bacterium]